MKRVREASEKSEVQATSRGGEGDRGRGFNAQGSRHRWKIIGETANSAAHTTEEIGKKQHKSWKFTKKALLCWLGVLGDAKRLCALFTIRGESAKRGEDEARRGGTRSSSSSKTGPEINNSL